MICLALVFPHELSFLERFRYLRWVGFIPSAALMTYAAFALSNDNSLNATSPSWQPLFIFTAASFLFFIILIAYRIPLAQSPITREQSRLILFWSLLSFSPLFLWFTFTSSWQAAFFTPYVLLPAVFFPSAIAYTLLRYRTVKGDQLANRGIVYALLSVITVISYTLLVTGAGLLFGSALPNSPPYVTGLVIFALAILFNPLKSRMQAGFDEYFARGQTRHREQLDSFSNELGQSADLPIIIDLVRRYAYHSMRPSQLHLFIFDPLSDHYLAAADDTGRPTTDLRFPSKSPLVEILSSRRGSVFMGESFTLPSVLQPEKARLALMGTHLFVPLAGRERLAGWLSLGSRRSGESYLDRDLRFLESLCDQAALAIERAQVVTHLERRMHEMNVLTRVSQGINVTLAFDDILELLYAQTFQVIPTLDFRITLHDQYSDYLFHVFYLENDERLNDKENLPLPLGQGLEREVIRSRRALITDDYERECRSRGVVPSIPGLFAWMSVPLNAGAEIIGLISLGSRDPSVNYTEEQLSLLKAIADQAAGAIVKGRLLQESERRTHQLTSLNEVARSLTSTLELDRLLNQILQSAVEILNCEAGSLLLADEQTDELVFEAAVGPVADDLIGQRLPAGAGLVGKAVETRQPLIANDVRRSKEWFDKPDQQTGFTTQDLLVTPMLVKDRVIGVIEVINRKDGLPFTPDDQELLAAFTSQAAVAMENARLYTLTDQALAARVEELSVMQRIDRELNASLDVARAMRITLSWAMRQSNADAGLVGAVEEEGIRIMASAGYTHELAPYENTLLPLGLPAIQQAISAGQPHSRLASQIEGGFGILNSCMTQAAIPIRREAETIGILLLEGKQAESPSEEVLSFLSRLTDHAAIAIANAQLYSAVEAANLAKSKFISFVAHELKNPMASIKGYTELVAGGMAGPVNEMQGSFLSTVNANVDRMNTIVSDLNDLTKIEMGSLRLEYQAVSVQEILEDVVRSLRRTFEEKSLLPALELPPDMPKVWADPGRLAQILTNLVSNASKYTPQGGEINIGAEQYTDNGQPSGAGQLIHVWIQDTGIGISNEDKQFIFQQYFRTNLAKDLAPGTGLGLHITKTLVEMQGGAIWFDSEVDKGSTFHFTIPVAEAV